jgi:hypothetical protein
MRPAELRSPSAQGAARRKGTSSLWLKRNWLLVALFALALASAGLSIALFIKPCDKKTSYETTNITTVVNLTTYENRTVLENVRSRRGTPTRLPTPSTRQRRISTRKRDGARTMTQHPDAGHGHGNGLATREHYHLPKRQLRCDL